VKQRILVVEDNPLSRELLCDWLELEGYEILTAADLKTAMAEVGAQRPDAVLLDVQLGEDDGLALARWMREEPDLRPIPVIAVTAHAMMTEQARMLQAGCAACISKPVDFKLLRHHLRRWLAAAGRLPAGREGVLEPWRES
jgi:two-component system cell cycle response regulator DivK